MRRGRGWWSSGPSGPVRFPCGFEDAVDCRASVRAGEMVSQVLASAGEAELSGSTEAGRGSERQLDEACSRAEEGQVLRTPRCGARIFGFGRQPNGPSGPRGSQTGLRTRAAAEQPFGGAPRDAVKSSRRATPSEPWLAKCADGSSGSAARGAVRGARGTLERTFGVARAARFDTDGARRASAPRGTSGADLRVCGVNGSHLRVRAARRGASVTHLGEGRRRDPALAFGRVAGLDERLVSRVPHRAARGLVARS